MMTFLLSTLSVHPQRESGELVDLLSECHARIRYFMALALEAGRRADVPVEPVTQACVAVERYFVEALPLHVADEEESIEPCLRGMTRAMDQALDAMSRQHQQHTPLLEALLRATAAVRNKPHDERARDALTNAAVALQSEMEEHLLFEESVVFPATRQLSREIRASIVDELRQRRSHGAQRA